MNRQAGALSGYPRAELIGQPVDLLVPVRAKAVHPSHRSAYSGTPRPAPWAPGWT